MTLPTIINALLLLLLIAGHTELMVAMVNRVHAWRLGCGTLRMLRHTHDVLVPLVPAAIVVGLGLTGPRLLRGGSWSVIPAYWWPWLGVCAAGSIGLVYSTMRFQWQRFHASRRSHTVTHNIVDVQRELQTDLLAPGPFLWLTRFPGNEVLKCDFSEKQITLPSLPPELDGMTIGHFSDFHFIGTIDRPYFEYVCERFNDWACDLVVFTGDLLDRQSLVSWLPATLGRIDAPLGRYFILGNHDWYLDASAIRTAVCEQGWEDVSSRSTIVKRGDCLIQLSGSEVPWMGTPPDQVVDSSDANHEFRILLSHTPDNLDWAVAAGYDLMLSGHNHGGQVVLPIIGPVYSPSRFGVKHAGGLYRKGGTTLHVSRGLSARHPLRLRCLPEVTRLVLRR